MIHIHTIIVDEKLGHKMCYEPHNSSPGLINSPLMWVCRKILALKWNKSLQNSVVCLFDSAAIFVKLSHRWLTLAVSVLTSNLVLCSYFVWLYFSSIWWIRNRKLYSMLKIANILFQISVILLSSRPECLFSIRLCSRCGSLV